MNTKIKDPHFLVVRFDAVGLPYAALCPDKDHIRKHHPDRALAFEIARDLYTLVGVATSTQATRDVLTIALLAMAQPTRYGDKVISLDPETLEPIPAPPKPEPVTVRVTPTVRCSRCFLVYTKQRMSEDGLCPVCVNETKGVR